MAPTSGSATSRTLSASELPLDKVWAFRIFFGFPRTPVSGSWESLPGQNCDLSTTGWMTTMAVSSIADDKKKALNLAIAQIEKSCGKGSIMRLGADNKVRVEAI